jgi:hypothetical protein
MTGGGVTIVPGGGGKVVPGVNDGGGPTGGGARTGGGVVGVWPGQMRMRSPEGSMRGPCQLAQPGATTAQAAATSAQRGFRHFLRRDIVWPSVNARACRRSAKSRVTVKLYRLLWVVMPFGDGNVAKSRRWKWGGAGCGGWDGQWSLGTGRFRPCPQLDVASPRLKRSRLGPACWGFCGVNLGLVMGCGFWGPA